MFDSRKAQKLWLLKGGVQALPQGFQVETKHSSWCPGPLRSLSQEAI